MDDTSNQQERLLDLAWLAGIYEGEGSFSLVQGTRGSIMPRINFINSDMEMVDAVCQALTRLGLTFYVQLRVNGCSHNPRHKTVKSITVAGCKRVSKMIAVLHPYIRGKKKYISEVVKAYCDGRLLKPQQGKNAKYTAEDIAFVNQVRALNKKGTDVSSETIRWQPGMSVEERLTTLGLRYSPSPAEGIAQ